MTITNALSAIGNNSSIYPLLVRDCGIEIPAKVLIARNENKKESKEIANEATREKLIDEYGTSLVWLGGIPLTEYAIDKFIKKRGYNPNVNLKLFKEEEKLGKNALQGIDINIDKFSKIESEDVQEAVKDLLKVKNNKVKYEKLLTFKFTAATIIPTIIMGFILPPLNFALTKKLREKKAQKISTQQAQNTQENKQNTNSQETISKNTQKGLTFTGSITSTIANLRTIDKMAISDLGLTVGRVSTSRNKEEGYVNAFRMIGSIILNFVTPALIAVGLDKLANKAFKINVNLDPIILDNKEFIAQIKNNTVELPKSNADKDLIEFLDKNPNSLFSKFAQKMKKVTYLKSGIRDPRKYIDLKDLANFKKEFDTFITNARNSKDVEKFAKRAKFVKGFNILANVGISSFLLAGALPKAQYMFNKAITGSYLDPGLK